MDLYDRTALAELELVAKTGCSPTMAQHAVKMAREWAIAYGARVRPEIREQATLDLFESRIAEMDGKDDWINRYVASMRDGPQKRG